VCGYADQEVQIKFRIIVAAGLLLSTVAVLSAQSSNAVTPVSGTPTPAAAINPPVDHSPDSAGGPSSPMPPARTPWRSGGPDSGHPTDSTSSPAEAAPAPGGPMPPPSSATQSSTDTRTVHKSATAPPATLADCANDGWRTYSGPAYKSQKACEQWVRKHVKASRTPGAETSHPGPATTPVPKN